MATFCLPGEGEFSLTVLSLVAIKTNSIPTNPSACEIATSQVRYRVFVRDLISNVIYKIIFLK